MEVNQHNLYETLPTILKRIAASHFIAFDLELSGIPTIGNRRNKGKQSLQERYAELKDAAEKYQILQIGLTAVEFDHESHRYLIRPYNFNLSPLIQDERNIDVPRDFTYSSSAVNFLRNENYDMNSAYQKGVPYLTRKETEQAWEKARLKWDRTMIPDMQIDKSDLKALDFMTRVRREIKTWQRSKKRSESIDIAGMDGGVTRMLSRFEKRLVHQIVRSDFPELVSISLLDSIKIKPKSISSLGVDDEQWRRITASAISMQTGFRWVTEALGAGNLDELDPKLCGRHIAAEPDQSNLKAFTTRLREIVSTCVQNPKILVGHNCFIDLIYFYRFFYGDLPETVEAFQAAVHATFPLVLDTKYMVTASDDTRFRSAQLWQVDQAFSKQDQPTIYLVGDHTQFNEDEKSLHQAGYDSFITSRVFLRLAAYLDPKNKDRREVDYPGSLYKDYQKNTEPNKAVNTSEGIARDNERDLAKIEHTSISTVRESRVDSRSAKGNKAGVASHNMFDCLSDSDMEAATEQAENPTSSSNTRKPHAVDQIEDLQHLKAGNDGSSGFKEADYAVYSIPGFKDDFWVPYRNKLRVFGSVEEACSLDPKEPRVGADAENKDEEQGYLASFSKVLNQLRQYSPF